MSKILVVDDDYHKPSLISNLAVSFQHEIEVIHCTTANDARKKIIQYKFDLLLIDINLPSALGSLPTALGGMDLYDLLIVDPNANIPSDICFITEKEDSLELYQHESNKRGIGLCRFITSSDSWKIHLTGKINLLINRRKKEVSNTPTADIAIVTALSSPELDSVLNLQYNWKLKIFRDDPTSYHFGIKQREDTNLTIVAASAMRKGLSSSSALAMKMVERFKPKLIVMLGICAGVPEKVNFGDIIIANPTWDWGSGKMSQDENGVQNFLSAPHQLSIDPYISQIAIELARNNQCLMSIMEQWKNNAPPSKLKAHIGPLASGSMVLAADNSLNHIYTQNKDLIGVDMEAYAVMAASEYARGSSPKSMVIKSVSDYADSTKDDKWQEYASFTSSYFFDTLISHEHFQL
ncbi:hypothetical protein RZP54_21820 [Raoultella ornithinolytica]|uniref:phosphorylase family protein n=1 Tax=Raoultella ornithinolytica TaxID=54291 RepID=UPI001A2A0428|nr:hypothetical protein [Raoultella ornithinolytica]MDV0591596.1 hypothetical protein [Raoultella ornithinolytica]HAT1561811.1 hypothetical protein [Raoultella ornithinolytica]HDT6530073.1 hypothetical protein [Raoultella ornithinolytica]